MGRAWPGNNMAELQVTFEVALDVDTVYNLDLFQKGWYQARFEKYHASIFTLNIRLKNINARV